MRPATATASYARLIASGDAVMLRRNGSPPTSFGPVRVKITSYAVEELTGNMQEGDRKAVVLADDVVASGIPLPLQPRQDRLILGPRTMVIQSVDDTSRRVGGQLIAYELRISGN